MKLVVFDLDGVLVPSRVAHFDALNQAISEIVGAQHAITREDHIRGLDGIPTKDKLARMPILNDEQRRVIADRKQELTKLSMLAIQPSQNLLDIVARLRSEGYTVAVASNSVRATVEMALERLELDIQIVLSNEDVDKPKPNPEIYLRAMVAAGVGPADTVIVEDSPTGREAAALSGARVVPVLCPEDVTYDRIVNEAPVQPKKWRGSMNVLIPMAGAGSRFAAAGFTFPKPLIEVRGKPMIQVVVENLAVDAHFIFVAQREHVEKYNLRQMLQLVAPGCDVVEVEGVTEGAACTALLAKDLIDNDTPLLIANADQFVDWDATTFYWWTANTDADGALLTFTNTHPKWSFVRVDENGFVAEVAEKRPISDTATCGIYWWRRGWDFITAVELMQQEDERTNGEFYIAPAFNQAIKNGAQVITWPIRQMWGLGTPEDLQTFLDEH